MEHVSVQGTTNFQHVPSVWFPLKTTPPTEKNEERKHAQNNHISPSNSCNFVGFCMKLPTCGFSKNEKPRNLLGPLTHGPGVRSSNSSSSSSSPALPATPDPPQGWGVVGEHRGRFGEDCFESHSRRNQPTYDQVFKSPGFHCIPLAMTGRRAARFISIGPPNVWHGNGGRVQRTWNGCMFHHGLAQTR